MRKTAHLFACLALALSSVLLLRIRSEITTVLWIPKLYAQSLAPLVSAIGTISAGLGLLARAPLAILAGFSSAFISAAYVRRVTASHNQFEQAFGPGWQSRIPAEQAERLPQRRWVWRLTKGPEPRWERNLPFWTLPGAGPEQGRQLLCDLWQPAPVVQPSGLAFIYLHGSAWHYIDKDRGTRPFFYHLAAQGHMVMDVAYRLCPETDLTGMLGDAKRAIAWLKSNAGRYEVNPERVVIGGGSAGGHLALLAAYTSGLPGLTPQEISDRDLGVRGVVSYYGISDMRAVFEHTSALRPERGVGQPAGAGLKLALLARQARQVLVKRLLGGEGVVLYTPQQMMRNLLGGLPEEAPEMYDLASPIRYAGADCPPTLLFHGSHDVLVPVETTRRLYQKLEQAGAPVVYVEFPQTDHAFDIGVLPFSPSAQAALYDLDRFLALLAASAG